MRDAIVAAARGCIGTRFRPQGRVPGRGLDCVGVVLVAARAAGVTPDLPAYALAGDHAAVVDAVLAATGCRGVATAAPGDILVIAPRADRRHLGIVTPLGLVHAHAGLGRVVEAPIDPGWLVVGVWRLWEG